MMNQKLGVFLRLSYVGSFLVLTKYLGSILSTTILFQAVACLIVAYIATIIFENVSSKNLALIKSWELRFLVWTICALWSPLIGFSLPGICLVFLSFLLLMVTLMNSEDFVEFIEGFFFSFITDSRFLGMMLLVLIFLVYIIVSEGWSGITSLFSV
jgi:hypothetical protein